VYVHRGDVDVFVTGLYIVCPRNVMLPMPKARIEFLGAKILIAISL
jgi:hypothetical protein